MDVRECMGANKINTVCEGLSARISEITNGRTGARILTNLCSKRTSKVSFKVPVEKLKWKNFDGKFVAERILETHFFAVDDEQRAVTNNKGIMNGIDAAAIAAGQDWRAIESAAHAFAAFKENADSKYSPLADYAIVSDGGREYLEGKLEMPISVGVVGGSVRTHPTFRMSHQILGNVSASELAQILLAVGLSANLAALRALATEGIQKGHMALHNRSVSMSRKGFGLDEENVLSK